MSLVVAVLNPKGGCGKTTTAIHIARDLHLRGQRVALIDSDPQGSARDWHAAGNGELIPVVGLDRPTLDKDIKNIGGYDWLIIDGSAKLESMIAVTVKCADVVLIPVQPSPYDIWATEDLVDLIKTRQTITGGQPKSAFVVTRKIENTVLGNEVSGALNDFGLPIFKSSTAQRQVYPRTATKGSTALDAEPNGKAAKEIKALTNELMEFTK